MAIEEVRGQYNPKEIEERKRAFWEKLRQVFDLLPALSMNAIYRFVAKNKQLDFPLLEQTY